jgi:hypothetical protein
VLKTHPMLRSINEPILLHQSEVERKQGVDPVETENLGRSITDLHLCTV